MSKRILGRQYQVGQPVVEAEVVRTLSTSRSTIREGFSMLASGGVIELAIIAVR